MKKISKIMSFATSLILFSQSLTSAMQSNPFEIINKGYAMAQDIFSIKNKEQLTYKINDLVKNIKDKKLPNNEVTRIVNHMCSQNNVLMRFIADYHRINCDDVKTNILRILNDNRNSEVNISLAEIVQNNEIKFLHILASVFSIIYNTINMI